MMILVMGYGIWLQVEKDVPYGIVPMQIVHHNYMTMFTKKKIVNAILSNSD